MGFNSGFKGLRKIVLKCRVPGSSVGIVTGYGLDGPGIKFRWGEIFRTCPDLPWGPPSLLYNGCDLETSRIGFPYIYMTLVA